MAIRTEVFEAAAVAEAEVETAEVTQEAATAEAAPAEVEEVAPAVEEQPAAEQDQVRLEPNQPRERLAQHAGRDERPRVDVGDQQHAGPVARGR